MDSTNKDIRIKLTTTVNEIKLDPKLQNQIIKSANMSKALLQKMIFKLAKYHGSKSLEIFINNKLFNENKSLHEFMTDNKILEETISEVGVEVYYCFQMDEPKLIDSKKQDEWIKKILRVGKSSILCAGLFNSELVFYDSVSKNKLGDKDKISEDETSDYAFLNDMCFALQTQNNDKCLAIVAQRDGDSLFDIKEISYENKNIFCQNGSIQGQNVNSEYNITCLSTNSWDSRIFAAGCSNGNLQLYRLESSYMFKDSQNKPNKKGKYSAKQSLTPISQAMLQTSAFSNVTWLDSSNIVTSCLETIRVFNATTLSLINSIPVNHHIATNLLTLNSNSLFMSCHDNGSIKTWDIRQRTPLIENINKAHNGFISLLVKPIEHDENKVFSCGYDGNIKLWDRRNTDTCYYKLPTEHKDKVFGCCEIDSTIITGGASGYIEYFKI